jgi:hypothetical protein
MWAMASKPFSISSLRINASTDVLAALVPLQFLRLQMVRLHEHENLRVRHHRTSSNSRWSHFTSDFHQTTSPCFQIMRGSKSHVLVRNRWVINMQS